MGQRFKFAAIAAACVGFAAAAAAQDMPPIMMQPVPPPTEPGQQTAAVTPPPPYTASASTTAAAPAVEPLSQARLDQLVAPIALYPDPVLTPVLMAATYPLEVVEASRWLREPANKSLTGEALTNALKAKGWDPSVMALTPFPRLLDLMADKLEWTDQLGNAFLAQQADVMAAVQRLRHAAMAAGNLQATPQCHCVIQTSGETISILPSDNSVVCIPVYNPKVVYGGWAEPAYPPVVFPVPVGFVFEPGIAIGFYPVIEVAAFGPLWGWGWFDWHSHGIVVDNARFGALAPGRAGFAGGVWVHDPAHRGGVAYHDPAVTARFGAARVAAVTAAGAAAARGSVGGAALRHQAVFAPGGGGAIRNNAAFRAGGPARGPAAARGGPVARAQFAPGPRGGGPHFGGGGPHGGGGGPRGGGGGPHGGGGGGGGGHHH